MKKIPELLAPAGSFDSLKMAVQYGADAIYLGAKEFSARRSAANFDRDELARAFDYCHERDVRAYLALNILIKDEEFNKAYDLGCECAQLGADALILQDIGLVKAFSDNTDIPIHISTQASLCSLYDVLSYKLPNVTRAVLARETPLADIRYIKQNSGIELEVFAHGALCVSFSGQCLMSSLAGGRSGNRGACAQPCRREYKLYKDDRLLKSGYLLSSKDLCTIEYLSQLADTGADSLKLEGRLKRPEYVGVTVSQYRNALDCIASGDRFDSETAKKALCEIFNRGGFTKGYYLNRENIIFSKQPNNTGVLIGKSLSDDGRKICFDKEISRGDSVELRKDGKSLGGGSIYLLIQNGKKTDHCKGIASINSLNAQKAMGALIFRTSSCAQIDAVNQGIRLERVKKPLNMSLFHEGAELCLTITSQAVSYTAQTECCIKADRAPDEKGIKNALSKLGGTPFEVCEIFINISEALFFTLSDVNMLRRTAVQGLLRKMAEQAHNRYSIKAIPAVLDEASGNKLQIYRSSTNKNKDKPKNIAEVRSVEELDRAMNNSEYQEIYFHPYDWDFFNDTACIDKLNKYQAAKNGKKIYFGALPGCFEQDYRVLERNIDCIRAFDGIVASSPGMIYFAEKHKLDFIAGAALNVFNSRSAAYFADKNALRICLSYELNKRQIGFISRLFASEIMLMGRAPAMLLIHCPRSASGQSCLGCEGDYYFTDKRGYRFPVKKYRYSFCRHIVYNSKITVLTQYKTELEKMGICAFRYVLEDADIVKDGDTTGGHYTRGIE